MSCDPTVMFGVNMVIVSAIIMMSAGSTTMNSLLRMMSGASITVKVASIMMLAAIITGCGGKSAKVVTYPAPKADPWVLEWRDPTVKTPAWLSNGLIGVRVGRDGTGSGPTAFDILGYQAPGGEEKILAQTNPLQCEITVGGERLDPAKSTTYRQTLDMRTGLLTTTWEQAIDSESMKVEATLSLAPHMRALTQTFTFYPGPGVEIRARSVAPGTNDGTTSTAMFAGQKMVISVEERGALNSLWRKEPGWLEYRADTDSGSVTLTRTVQIGPVMPKAEGNPHPVDIEIEGPVEDQQAVRSFLYYLRSSIHPRGTMAVSPFGLSSERYFGHVFWDADVWVFPALCLLDPARAKVISDYRLRMGRQAFHNFEDWILAGRPTGKGNMSPITGAGRPPAGLKYPWESSVSGRETVPGPSKFQDHITGSVTWGLGQAAALDLIRQMDFEQVLAGATSFYAWRSEGNPREIKGTMSPDEFFTGDNDLYTNLVAQFAADKGKWGGGKFITYKLPRDDKGLLTYDGDPVRTYKQAAALLAIYPLQYPEAEAQATEMLARFGDKVTPNGPAMSDSVAALIGARFGDVEAAYGTWRKSWMDYTKHPLLLFSEKRKSEQTYFVTGAAGCLQTVLYGFLGFRIDYWKQPGAAWSTPLLGGNWLSCKPKLPKAWTKVTLKNFVVLGKRYTLTVDHNRVTVTQGDF